MRARTQKFFTLLSASLLWASIAMGQVVVTPPSGGVDLTGLTDGCLLYDNSDALGCSPLTTDGTDVTSTGDIILPLGTAASQSLRFLGEDIGFYSNSTPWLFLSGNSGTLVTGWRADSSIGQILFNGMPLGFESGFTGTADVKFSRLAAGQIRLSPLSAGDSFLDIRNDDDASNYEGVQIGIDATNNDVEITAVTAGTGDDDIDVLIGPVGTGFVGISPDNALTAPAHTLHVGGSTARIMASAYSGAAATGGTLYLAKSRNATVGSFTDTNNGDTLGRIYAVGTGAGAFDDAAQIEFEQESITSGHVLGSIIFHTNRTGGAMTEALRIMNSGALIQDEVDANPGTGDLDADDSIAVYSKADTFVIAYNNGSTMTYLPIPLDGSTTTWTHGTSAP